MSFSLSPESRGRARTLQIRPRMVSDRLTAEARKIAGAGAPALFLWFENSS